ncbi:hypothetical protein B0H17DRAFT_1148191 [Mycena rosella]|uniref:Uncharacterized protein n=1 Tax=Mycena rosella TaxID=1033263 RepID=A0AAD7FVQ4_MYCRO|nr:hypothetical protein B0H17DRAFT_1148191 [Mycena rosella]
MARHSMASARNVPMHNSSCALSPTAKDSDKENEEDLADTFANVSQGISPDFLLILRWLLWAAASTYGGQQDFDVMVKAALSTYMLPLNFSEAAFWNPTAVFCGCFGLQLLYTHDSSRFPNSAGTSHKIDYHGTEIEIASRSEIDSHGVSETETEDLECSKTCCMQRV